MNTYQELLEILDINENSTLSKDELLKKLPQATFIENNDTDTQGFMMQVPNIFDEGQACVISFRGTEQKLRDWFTDLNGFQMIYPYDNTTTKIRVHTGFMNAYKSVRSQIHEYLKNKIPTFCVVCGHSLGGALATLCAIDIQYNALAGDVNCFTFGSPKVGNKEFIMSYNKRVPRTFRCYMRNDIVPCMPPEFLEFMSGKYYHIDVPIPIGPRDPFFGLKVWFKNHFQTNRLMTDLTNHAVSMYKKELEKHL
jgi:predicted lipase